MNLYSSSILIVDDNPYNLQVLGRLLKDNNYEIEFALNGEAALDWLSSRQFDLILLDINMPLMNGFEVCRRIRSNPLLNSTPVIFLSGESERDNILMGFELGAQDYITKPFDSRELLVRVRTHLVLKDSLEKLEKLNRSLEEKVTDRTRQLNTANENLKILNLKLFDLDRSKAEFLNLISHEIRTPLNGIMGVLELLKESGSTDDIMELIDILNISTRRLERFALDALLITRLKTKQFEIRKERINLTLLLDEILVEIKETFQTENIRFERKDEIAGFLIYGEIELIKKAISNILENAIHSSPEEGIIRINTLFGDHTIICEIKDQGQGFAAGTTDTVFELFTTGDPYADNSTGIGLPVTKMIMESHGGNITISNNPDGGACVKLLFRSYQKE